MQDPKNNTVQSTEQPTLPTTTPYGNFLYTSANNFPVDSNRGPYGMMTPYNMFPMNQWPHTEGLSVNSNNTGNPITTASDMTTLSSTATNNIPIMSANQTASGPSNLNVVTNSSAVSNHVPAYMNSPIYGMGDLCCSFPMSELENNVVTLSHCVLYPPRSAPIPNTRPSCCWTILVRGLPEKATEEVVREVFERIGKIVSIRKIESTYAVKYVLRNSVDRATILHGWGIKVENKDDPSYAGILNISYQNDEKSNHPGCISPQPFVPYSEKEMTSVLEKLDDEVNFEEAVQVLISWLERGECNKRNANSFYSAIQKTYNRGVQKLMSEKAKFEENLHKAKATLNDKILGMTSQLKEFEKVLDTTRLQKVWDHLSKAQRKNIDFWTKEISDIKESCVNELIDDRIEDEMEMSDDEGIKSISDDGEKEDDKELNALKEQMDDLQNELQAAEQEVKEVKKEREEAVKDGLREFGIVFEKIRDNEKQVEQLKKLLDQNSEDSVQESHTQSKQRRLATTLETDVPESVAVSLELCENDIRQIGLIATFLNTHPFGASLDYISSYLCTIDPDTNARDIENVMKQLPAVFREESLGIGSSLRKKWKFWGFEG